MPYWGPYSEAWDPKRLFLSANMSQVYAGALPMLAILVFGVARGLAWTREIRFFSLALIVLIVYGLGRYTPAYRLLFDFLPGVSVFRRPADATFMIGAASAIVGGYLVHRVATGSASLARSQAAIALGLIAVGSRSARRGLVDRPCLRCRPAVGEGCRLGGGRQL